MLYAQFTLFTVCSGAAALLAPVPPPLPPPLPANAKSEGGGERDRKPVQPQLRNSFLIIFVCDVGGSLTPHPTLPPDHFFECKFSRHGDNLSSLTPGSPSITVLGTP